VDFDVVDESNLQRQILHGTSTLGQSKLESAKARLLDLNPYIEVICIEERLSSENALELFEPYDVIADGTDNFPTRYLVNDACVILGKPNVYGSIFRFEGQLTVFNYKGGPCYRCLYSEPPPPGLVPSCAEGGVLGVLPGVIGSLQANEVIKVLLNLGDVASGRLILYDALKMRFRELKCRRLPSCTACSAPEKMTLIDYEQFCSPAGPQVANEEVPALSVHQLDEKRGSDSPFQLLDVREPHEQEICCISGAKLIPLGQLKDRLSELDQGQVYVVHCKSGARSAKAVRILLDSGFENVYNLEGGILEWASKIDPSMPSY